MNRQIILPKPIQSCFRRSIICTYPKVTWPQFSICSWHYILQRVYILVEVSLYTCISAVIRNAISIVTQPCLMVLYYFKILHSGKMSLCFIFTLFCRQFLHSTSLCHTIKDFKAWQISLKMFYKAKIRLGKFKAACGARVPGFESASRWLGTSCFKVAVWLKYWAT